MSKPNETQIQNPRKRSGVNFGLFQRAIQNLNSDQSTKFDTKSSSPPSKRQRTLNENECKNPCEITVRPSHNSSFNSFSKPPPNLPSQNFLHDRSRNNYDRKRSMRHTPKTRLFSPNHHSHSYNEYQSNPRDISTRTYHSKHHRDHNSHSHTHHRHKPCQNGYSEHHHHHAYSNRHPNKHLRKQSPKYAKVEQHRMKKLWTDFVDKSQIFNQLKFCEDTSYYITSNSIAHRISNIIKILLNQHTPSTVDSTLNILDGLSCIGGNTYSFAKVFAGAKHHIYGNELDWNRFNALKHNMSVLEKCGEIKNDTNASRFHFYNLDFLKLHETLSESTCDAMDVIFLDPEWNNGDDYKQTNRREIHLFNIGSRHLYQVIDDIVSAWYRNVKVIAVKLAKNYDRKFIVRKLMKCKLIQDKVFRMGEIAFKNQKLIVIVREFDGNVQSFEDVLNGLPKDINTTTNDRDDITVQLLS